MENFRTLIDEIFKEEPYLPLFIKKCEDAFGKHKELTKEEEMEIFQILSSSLGVNDTQNQSPNVLGKFFFFLAELSSAIKSFQNAFLSFEKALFFIKGEGLGEDEKFVSEKMRNLFNLAFSFYNNDNEALEDYFFLCKNMILHYLDELRDRGYEVENFSDLYVTQLEVELFDRFSIERLKSPRAFWDFQKYITYREVATKISKRELRYFRLIEKFNLSTMDFLIIMLLYFSITVRSFERILKKAWSDYLISQPTVAFLEEIFSFYFPVKNFVHTEFGQDSLLVKTGIIHIFPPSDKEIASIYENLVVLDDNIVSFLKGGDLKGSCIEKVIISEHRIGEEIPPTICRKFNNTLEKTLKEKKPKIYIYDPFDSGVYEEILRVIDKNNKEGIVVIDLERISLSGQKFHEDIIKSVFLYSNLKNLSCVFLVKGAYKEDEKRIVEELLHTLNKVSKIQDESFFLTSREDLFDMVSRVIENISFFRIDPPKGEEQIELWKYYLKKFNLQLDEKEYKELLFTMPKARVNVKKILFRFKDMKEKISMCEITELVSKSIEVGFGFVAQKITPGFSWDDIILDHDCLVKLNEIITFFRYREQVMKKWGFEKSMPYGKSLSALFYGPPGTGKTMMAHVIAKDLNMDLFRVELSTVISKYIGETEKNLKKIFDVARETPTILLFEEADSLFTKRTQVQTSIDRYANVEVNYLLQRMEDFDGITILTTNNFQNIDEAFKRRIKFRILFPMPDIKTRKLLWRGFIPTEAEISEDIDFDKLAAKFELSPAHIKNAVLRAAFIAAENNSPINNKFLFDAAGIEAKELGFAVRDQI